MQSFSAVAQSDGRDYFRLAFLYYIKRFAMLRACRRLLQLCHAKHCSYFIYAATPAASIYLQNSLYCIQKAKEPSLKQLLIVPMQYYVTSRSRNRRA